MNLIGEIRNLSLRLKKFYKHNFHIQFLRILARINRVKIPGFKGAGLIGVIKFFYDGLTDRTFTLAASAMASRFFFSLFPGLIFLFTLFPYIPVDGIQESVVSFLGQIVPAESIMLVNSAVEEVFSYQEFGLLSINLGIMLFSSLQGIVAMMYAFSKEDEEVFHKRNIFGVYGVALLICFGLFFAFTFSLGFYIGSDWLILQAQEGGAISGWVQVMLWSRWIILFLVFSSSISFVYYLAPETQERFSFFSPGALIASLLSLLAFWGFNMFLADFANYNKFYGSLSALMILMVWFYWMSIVLLIGFELNAAIALAKKKDRPRLKVIRKKDGIKSL